MAMLNNQRVYTYILEDPVILPGKQSNGIRGESTILSTSGHIVPAEEWLSSHRLQAVDLFSLVAFLLDNEIPNSFTTNRSVC